MLETLLSAAVPIVGSLIGSSANKRAADRASDAQAQSAQIQADANREARQEFRAAADRGIGAIRSGTAGYAATIAPLLTPTPIQLPMRRGLTPNQEIARDDLRRQGLASISASGLRGSGAGVRSVMDADRRFVTGAADQNDRETRGELRRAQGSADSARRGLAGIYAQEGSAIANTEIGQGNRVADSMATDGRVQGQATATGGAIDAQATTANGNLWGEAMGALGSVIADAAKGGNWEKYKATGGSI